MSTRSPAEPTPTGTEGDATAAANGRFVPPPPPPSPPQGQPSQLAAASKVAGRQLLRPRVRVALVGVAAILAAWWFVDGSLGTILTIAGIVALAVAWLGSRMEGRFAVEWGASGTRVEFDAGLTPAPDPVAAAPAKPALNPARASAPAPKPLSAVPPPPPAAATVIEGEAQTVEIDVAELKALIAAAEQAEQRRAS
jgi:hypothetical protein